MLRAVSGGARGSGRPYPAADRPEPHLSEPVRRRAAALMRVDHAGEVAAQALYHGQSLTARSSALRADLERAAREESDHLIWCRRRLGELGARTSVLDPLWYALSFSLGAAAGLAGDRVSLGFLAETERQVMEHLEEHLRRLPEHDDKSRAVLGQMYEDEAGHARTALEGGAAPFPAVVKRGMRLVARVMTRTAYWL